MEFLCAMTFSDLKVTRQYLDVLDDMGITTPTEIQQKAIPRIRAGQDVIGIAQTGTGKTLAFLLPLMAMLSQAKGQGPRGVILTPAKELALQIGTWPSVWRNAPTSELRWSTGALGTVLNSSGSKPVSTWSWPRPAGSWSSICGRPSTRNPSRIWCSMKRTA